MKNDSNPIIRSQEVTIDMHICAALSESRGSGEIYFAAIAPDMELTVITLDEAPDILPCFDEDDAYLNIPDSSLLLSYNPAQVLKLAGKRVDNMLLKEPAAMKCAFGENPKGCYGQGLKKSPMTRMAVAALLRELLFKTQRYRVDKLTGKNPPFDMKLEAMLPVVNGEIPLKCHAHRADDILTAVRIAREFGLKATLDHCTDGELIADELAKEGLPVFVGPTLGSKSKAELRHKSFTTPGTLYKAGLTVSIITDAPVIPLEKLPMCAGLAADAGLPMDEAWRAITINPARSLGIDSRVGSLEPGKDADFVLWTADPLTTIGGQAYMTVIDGRIVYQAE